MSTRSVCETWTKGTQNFGFCSCSVKGQAQAGCTVHPEDVLCQRVVEVLTRLARSKKADVYKDATKHTHKWRVLILR